MMFSRTILATTSLFAIMALTAYGTEIEFCTDSVYAPGDVCPEAQPSSGSGTCHNLTVEVDTCYTFDDFPSVPSDLIGNVAYIWVPGGDVSSCDLYRTQNCTVGPTDESASVGTGSYDLLCRYHIGSYTESWICS